MQTAIVNQSKRTGDDLSASPVATTMTARSNSIVDEIEPVEESAQAFLSTAQPGPAGKHARTGLRTICHVSAACWILGILAVTVYLPNVVEATGNEVSSCAEDGRFILDPSNYTAWSTSDALYITLGFGSLSFSTVKLIDVIWDVLVGRGLQAFLGFFTYKVITMSLARLMENGTAVSYTTFEALAFDQVSLASVVKQIRGFNLRKGWSRRVFLAWMVIASIYLVFFPTFVSAMTGYSSNTSAFVTDQAGGLLPWGDCAAITDINFQIQDGLRIGLNDNFTGGTASSEYGVSCLQYYGDFILWYETLDNIWPAHGLKGTQGTTNTSASIPPYCWFPLGVLYYKQYYHLDVHPDGTYERDTSFVNHSVVVNLTEPALTIDLFYASGQQSWDGIAVQLQTWPNETSYKEAYYCPGQLNIYPYDYVLENATCVPEKTYKWGFSFLLLMCFLITTLLWSIGMYIVWIDACLSSRLVKEGRSMGLYRAAADLTHAMQLDMGVVPAFELSENDLRKGIRLAQNGHEVRYDIDKSDKEDFSSALKEKRVMQQGLLSLLKRVISGAASNVASSVLINEWRSAGRKRR